MFSSFRVGVDFTQLKNEAVKRLKGEVEAENPSKKKKAEVSSFISFLACNCFPSSYAAQGTQPQRSYTFMLTSKYSHKQNEGPKMLDEYCKDLCEEVKAGKIDPVRHRIVII